MGESSFKKTLILATHKTHVSYKNCSRETCMDEMKKLIEEAISASFKNLKAGDEQDLEQIKKELQATLYNSVSLENLKQRLAVFHEFEKNYLELVRDFKEEIKFAANLQEEIRKERAKFFSDTLAEVSETLSSAQVEESTAQTWLRDLVDSYTKSLNLSENLVEEKALETITQIREASRKTLDVEKENGGGKA